jgi:AIPR protein
VITFVGIRRPSGEDARLSLVSDISKASNSQTKVEESDRRSNDPVQLKLQQEFFEQYGLYYERKRGEFSDGVHYGYLPSALVLKREKLVRVSLACDYRANETRSSISKFFDETVFSTLLRIGDAGKYAYGYEVLDLLERKRKEKPKTKGDRYHTREFGQALRYGQYAVVAVCANLGPPAKKTEAQAQAAILSHWMKFEHWAEKQPSNKGYMDNGSFDYVNYYKGSTINSDLQSFAFSV